MGRTFRVIVASLTFWVLFNVIAVYQLRRSSTDDNADNDTFARPHHHEHKGVARQSRNALGGGTLGGASDDGSLPVEIESEDSVSDSTDGSEGSDHKGKLNEATRHAGSAPPHAHDAREDRIEGAKPSTVPSTEKKEKKKDTIARSFGNSKEAAATVPVNVGHESIRFMVIGDWGGPGREPQKNVAKSMDKIATSDDAHHVDFIISTGDNMYEDGVSGVHDKKFKRNFENVYTQPSLQVRWYMSLGNHDHGAHGVMRDAQAEVNYTALSPRWFLPSTFYTQMFRLAPEGDGTKPFEVQLFVLDTYDYSPRVTQMTEEQLKWFERELKASRAEVKIVVGHRPLFSAGAKHGSSPYMQKKLQPLFVKYGVSLYMCGDDHELQVMESLGVLHLLSGGGARAKKDLKPKGIPQTKFQAGVHGFMWVEVGRSVVVVEVYNQHGEQLHRMTHPTAAA